MDTNKFRDDFLFAMAIEDVDSQTMDWLTKQDFYRELRKELRQLEEKYPCIEAVLEGEGEVSLTKEEHEALVHYLEIEQKKESAERREYYYFGHIHAQRYCNDIEKRKCYVAKDKISTKQCKGQELPEWLDGFIHRLDILLEENLLQNDSYRELKQNESEILQKYPVIRRLIEGGIIEEEITLSVNEQKAFEKFFFLQLNMDNYRELALYKIGQEDLVKYFSMLLF